MEELAVENKKNVEKRRITRAAPFILSEVFASRYSTAGVSSILVMFLNLKLGYDKDASTALYHSYLFLGNLCTIVGAIVTDGWWGSYNTMIRMSFVLASGAFIVAVGTVDTLNLPIVAFSVIGLVIIPIASGMKRPASYSFPGDQYASHELKSIALFYSVYYFVFNCGSITSRLISPILRADVNCFGGADCYPLAFGIPGIMNIVIVVLLLIGKRFSVCHKASGSTLLSIFACIWHALTMRSKSRKGKLSPKAHWLDYAEEKYGSKMIADTKSVLNVIVLFPPLPLFWALFDQQGSRWVFMAKRMDGNVGIFTIKPDQISILNPTLVILLIPIFEYVLNPLFVEVGIKTHLQRATLGGVFAGLAFVISAFVETQIETRYIHMLWLLPQYLFITLGEILLHVSLIEFCHIQAPESMKTVLQGFRMLTQAGGNIIVAVVAGARLVKSQVYEFLLFAGLMFVDMMVFGFLIRKYKYVKQSKKPDYNDSFCDQVENIEK